MPENYPKQYEVWIADLDPTIGSEPGKTRPVVILQSNDLNKHGHSSFICCSVSSQHKVGVSLIRLAVEPNNTNGLLKTSYILCDQIRAIDTNRLKEKIGVLDEATVYNLTDRIKIILSL